MIWSREQVALLRANWTSLPASKIALLLGHGCSRNAVIGKAYRLGLDKRPPPPPPVKRKRKRRGAPWTMADSQPPVFVDFKPERSRHAVDLLHLENGMCKWVTNDGSTGGYLYCGARIVPGGPYCARHARLGRRA